MGDDPDDGFLAFGDAPFVLLEYDKLTVQEPLIPPTIYAEMDRFVRSLLYEPRPPRSTIVGVTSHLDTVRSIKVEGIEAYFEGHY